MPCNRTSLSANIRRNVQSYSGLFLVLWVLQLMTWSTWAVRSMAESWHPLWITVFTALALASAAAITGIVWMKRHP